MNAKRCTFHRPHERMCDRLEGDPIHTRPDERRLPGYHVFQVDPKVAHRLGKRSRNPYVAPSVPL